MKSDPLVFERVYNAPVEIIWKALTDPDQMRQWYFNVSDFRPEVGFIFSFEGGKDDLVYVHFCQVTEVIPERKLTYSWRFKGFDGISFLTFDLKPEGPSSTFLRLTHQGLESFPANNPDFARESFKGGWTHFMDAGLPKFLEKVTAS